MKPIIFNLDIQEDSYESCDLMQGYDYNIQFNITDGYTTLDLTGVSIQIQMQKADHKFIIQTEKITVVNNIINVAIDKDLTRVNGKGKLQVVLSKDNRTFGSWVVKCNIKANAINDNDGQTENKVTITEALTNKITEANNTKVELDKSIANGDTKKMREDINKNIVDIKNNSSQLEDNITKTIKNTNDIALLQKTMLIRKTNNLIEVMFKYNNTSDMILSFNKFGNNNIFDIYGVELVSNTGKVVSGDFSSARTILAGLGGTDWIGPYKVRATTNIDGDNPASSHFTGGNHGYNFDATSTPTGRTISVLYYADGSSLIDGEVKSCQKLIITKLDYIQATNTKKSDGSGREVIEQKVRYIVTPGKIEIEHELTAKEAIEIDLYYGLQMPYYTGYQDKIFYYDGYDERRLGIGTSNVISNSGTPTTITNPCVSVVVTKNGNNCRVTIDKNRGIGNFKYLLNTQPYFDTRSNKLYCNLVNGVILARANTYKKAWFGSYEFYYQD